MFEPQGGAPALQTECRFLRQAQDRLFDCVINDETVNDFAQDDNSFND